MMVDVNNFTEIINMTNIQQNPLEYNNVSEFGINDMMHYFEGELKWFEINIWDVFESIFILFYFPLFIMSIFLYFVNRNRPPIVYRHCNLNILSNLFGFSYICAYILSKSVYEINDGRLNTHCWVSILYSNMFFPLYLGMNIWRSFRMWALYEKYIGQVIESDDNGTTKKSRRYRYQKTDFFVKWSTVAIVLSIIVSFLISCWMIKQDIEMEKKYEQCMDESIYKLIFFAGGIFYATWIIFIVLKLHKTDSSGIVKETYYLMICWTPLMFVFLCVVLSNDIDQSLKKLNFYHMFPISMIIVGFIITVIQPLLQSQKISNRRENENKIIENFRKANFPTSIVDLFNDDFTQEEAKFNQFIIREQDFFSEFWSFIKDVYQLKELDQYIQQEDESVYEQMEVLFEKICKEYFLFKNNCPKNDDFSMSICNSGVEVSGMGGSRLTWGQFSQPIEYFEQKNRNTLKKIFEDYRLYNEKILNIKDIQYSEIFILCDEIVYNANKEIVNGHSSSLFSMFFGRKEIIESIKKKLSMSASLAAAYQHEFMNESDNSKSKNIRNINSFDELLKTRRDTLETLIEKENQIFIDEECMG